MLGRNFSTVRLLLLCAVTLLQVVTDSWRIRPGLRNWELFIFYNQFVVLFNEWYGAGVFGDSSNLTCQCLTGDSASGHAVNKFNFACGAAQTSAAPLAIARVFKGATSKYWRIVVVGRHAG